MERSVLLVVIILISGLTAGRVEARTLYVPEGGRAVAVAREGVACGPLPEGWSIEAQRFVRPPAPGSEAPRAVEVKVASELQGCEESTSRVRVVALDAVPELEPEGISFWPDEGRLELRGRRLKGLQVLWKGGGKEGRDACLEPAALPQSSLQQCVIPLVRQLPLDTVLSWLPAGVQPGEAELLHDGEGGLLDAMRRVLRPARIYLSGVLPPAAVVDVSQGPGRVPLVHPGAVASVDCGQARCELVEDGIRVRSVPALAHHVTMRLRLAARTLLQDGEAARSQLTATLPLVQCPLAIASGPPLRGAYGAQLVVRMDPRCASEARARWHVNEERAELVRVEQVREAAYVVLRVGRLLSDEVTVTARRADLDGTIIGSVSASTVPAPVPRVGMELPKNGRVDFIPTNRDALLTVAGAGEHARLVPLSVEGAYTVRPQPGHYLVRGDENAGGFVTLRFGYRAEGLPPELGPVDLAIISERVQRAVREASVPAPFSTTVDGEQPLVELLCSDKRGRPRRMAPHQSHRLSFESRDTCRLVLHRERLEPEFGLQEVLLEVEVTRAEGGRRAEASFSERMVLIPGADTRVVPLKGGTEEFDRIVVRLSHVLDESRYALNPTSRQGLPAAQWLLTNEGSRLRLYATAAIPAGLYRINKPSGQLTLNFGVLSRITWLNEQGKEALPGLELGLMGMSLVQRPGALEFPATLAAIAGLGLRVPLGSGAAVGLHLWGAYEFREPTWYKVNPKEAGECALAPGASGPACQEASRFSLIFGPSISIGNVGANL